MMTSYTESDKKILCFQGLVGKLLELNLRLDELGVSVRPTKKRGPKPKGPVVDGKRTKLTEDIRAYNRKWYAENKERFKAYNRKAKDKKYRENNREKVNKIHNDYYHRNKERILQQRRERRNAAKKTLAA